MKINLKRAYDKTPQAHDGIRILVDRLWPRGLTKEKVNAIWIKDIAPSTELRKWFNHDPEKWAEFKKKYLAEIHNNSDALAEIKKAIGHHKIVTLIYGAKDTEHNEAVVLQEYLEKILK